jgi:hypothetical protein
MKIGTAIAIAAGILAVLAGCESFTEGYDKNPLLPTTSTPQKTFVGAELAYVVFTEGFPSQLASMWSQQATGAERQFGGYYVYTTSAVDFGTDWFFAYTSVLANLRLVQSDALAAGQPTLAAAAKILEGVHMGTVAAVWGDVPYSEAVRPEVTTTPTYDPQLSVYAAALAMIDAGINEFAANPAPLSGDVFSLSGIPALWIKLGHSAKARYLMHTARSAGYAADHLNQILSEGALGVLATNGSEDLLFRHGVVYQGDMNLWNSFQNFDRSGYLSAEGNFAVPLMKARGLDGKTDEAGRLSYYYTADGRDVNTGPGGAFAVDEPFPGFRASETHLLMAEAHARLGNVSAAVAELNLARQYNNDAYGNSSEDFTTGDFLTPGDLLQAIFNETYLSLMHQVEAFSFLRRIDYGISYRDSAGSTVTLQPTNGTQFPQRFLYPTEELNANPNRPAQTSADLFRPTAANMP